MEYRKFGKADWKISSVSLGALRIEDAAEADGSIAIPDYSEVIKHAIGKGVNYIDLGYPQYFADPEKAAGRVSEALSGGLRESVKTAVNISSRGIASQQALSAKLDGQLKLFGLDKADFCVIGDVNRGTWNSIKSVDIAGWAEKTVASGKAGDIGLKFHDNAHFLKGIIDTFPYWAFLQIELSLLDYTHHPGVGCFKYSDEHDIAVIATDITKAGRLLRNIPGNVLPVMEESRRKMGQEERCIRWTLNFREVSSVLMSARSEMYSIEQTDRYLSYIDGFSPGDVDIWEMLDAAKIRDAYYSNRNYRCTACRCCTPCPEGIDMPRLVELVNDGAMLSDSDIPGFQFNLEKHQDAKCIRCGVCNSQCPKYVPLEEAVNEAFSKYSQYGREDKV